MPSPNQPPFEPADLAAAEAESAGFFRWALPAAAGVALGVGLVWWSFTLHQERKPFTQLRDGAATMVIDEQGNSPAFHDLPPDLHEVVEETLRTGAVPMPAKIRARAGVAEELRRHELEEWKRIAGDSHLLLGIANARAGLRDDALREFRLLAEQNPQSSLARKLLENAGARSASPDGSESR